MKLIYIVPNINNEGGVARVLSTKINYLIEKFDYEIHIVTQNNGNFPLFYDFNKNINYHDITLKGNLLFFLYSYKMQLNNLFDKIKPNHIVVVDNGIKAFFVPLFFSIKRNILLEIHSSIYLEENPNGNVIWSMLKRKFKLMLCAKFTTTVFETIENQQEWSCKNAKIITNPLWFSADTRSNLQNKKVIAVARHTYEKGLDRLLKIWSKIITSHPDWHLDIYGSSDNSFDLGQLVAELKLSKHCTLYEPSKKIEREYLNVSIFALTSRFEAFGMVLIEAMESGLPCIAYDCPCGPRTIIKNNQNGFLIKDGKDEEYISKLNQLIENDDLRIQMGKNATNSVKKYDLEIVMKQWKALFEN